MTDILVQVVVRVTSQFAFISIYRVSTPWKNLNSQGFYFSLEKLENFREILLKLEKFFKKISRLDPGYTEHLIAPSPHYNSVIHLTCLEKSV